MEATECHLLAVNAGSASALRADSQGAPDKTGERHASKTCKNICYLLDRVPAELRNAVYELLAPDDDVQILSKFPLGLVLSCKQIRVEFLPLYLSQVKHWCAWIEDKDYEHVIQWLRAVGPENMHYITSLTLSFSGSLLKHSRGRYHPSFDQWHGLIAQLSCSGLQLSQLRHNIVGRTRSMNINNTQLTATLLINDTAAFEAYLFIIGVLQPLYLAHGGGVLRDVVRKKSAYPVVDLSACRHPQGLRSLHLGLGGEVIEWRPDMTTWTKQVQSARAWIINWINSLPSQRKQLVATVLEDKPTVLTDWDRRYKWVLRFGGLKVHTHKATSEREMGNVEND